MVGMNKVKKHSEALALLLAEVTDWIDLSGPLPAENFARMGKVIKRFDSELEHAHEHQRQHARDILVRLEKRLQRERAVHQQALRAIKKQDAHLRAAQSWAKGQLQIL